MTEHHVEFESTRLRLGMQLGQARFGLGQGSPDLFPTFVVGWNYRIYIGFTLGWLIWYVNFYVITPAYVQEILKRREFLAKQAGEAGDNRKMDVFLKEMQ